MLLSQRKVDIYSKLLAIAATSHNNWHNMSHVDLYSLLQLILIWCSIESVSSLILLGDTPGPTGHYCSLPGMVDTAWHWLILWCSLVSFLEDIIFMDCQITDKAVKLREILHWRHFALRTYIWDCVWLQPRRKSDAKTYTKLFIMIMLLWYYDAYILGVYPSIFMIVSYFLMIFFEGKTSKLTISILCNEMFNFFMFEGKCNL